MGKLVWCLISSNNRGATCYRHTNYVLAGGSGIISFRNYLIMIEVNDMDNFRDLHTLDEVSNFIHKHQLAFLYITQPNCSVCHGLLPQVQALMEKYPKIALAKVDAVEVQAIAGEFSIFTAPVLLLFIDGKEYLREARIVQMDLFEEKLDRIYHHVI